MDFFGIQALGDSSCESDTSLNSEMPDTSMASLDDSNVQQSDVNQNGAPEVQEKTFGEKREELYGEYKNGLMLISRQQFDEADELFERLISSEILNFDEELDGDSHERLTFTKELVQLKYIILKNLALINTKENKLNHEKALNFLIQAAEIDSSDACLWYEIGENAFQLDRYLISRWAYEESLRLSPANWPCLDKLIVLLFALGHYSACLKHVFNALKMDRFYFNGLLLMKKIETFRELHYSQQIELFQRTSYEANGLELESLFDSFENAELSGQLLFDRIDQIKFNYRKRFVDISQDDHSSEVPVLRIAKSVSTWKDLGTALLKAYELNEHRVHLPFKVCLEDVNESRAQPEPTCKLAASGEAAADHSAFGTPKTSSIPVNLPGSRSIKRKKFDSISNDDSQSKRRSLRRDNSAYSQNEKNITDILKEFVDENYLRDIQTFTSPSKKVTFNETVKQLKSSHTAAASAKTSDQERHAVQMLILSFVQTRVVSLYHMIRAYLKELSLNYGYAWSSGVDEIYLNLFNSLTNHYDLLEAILDPANDEKFLYNCSTILVYLEIEFSKFRELQQKHLQSGSAAHDKAHEALSEQYLTKLTFKLHELDINLERYHLTAPQDAQLVDTALQKESERFELRISCLNLFTCLNKSDENGSSDYQVKRIFKLLDFADQSKPISLPNSKIFSQISKESVKEFLKLNEKKKILNSNSQIESMFNKAKYQEIIDHLEEFADTHKLPLEDASFKSSIYVQLLKSYMFTNQYEKSGYFSRKFLRQIISHFSEQAAASMLTDDDFLTQEQEKLAKKLEARSRDHSKIFSFITELLEIIQNLLEINQSSNANLLQNFYSDTSSNSNSVYPSGDQLVIHETVWLMYQLISIFFDNSETASRFEQYKPIKPFVVLFNCMSNHSLSDRIDFVSSIHEYLAKSRICRVNHGEFLLWSIDVLMGFVDKCEACNEKVIENESSNEMNEDVDILNASDFKEKVPSRKQRAKKPTMSKCSDCDDCKHLLEQSFHCLFGYKTKTNAKYLESHSCTSSASTIAYSLANSVSLYKHFKPAKLPEYDDLAKQSIPVEFYDFLREVIKLTCPQVNGEEEQEDEVNADEETSALFDAFKDDFQEQEVKDMDGLLEKLRDSIPVPAESQRDIYYLLADFNFKNQKPASLASGYYIKDLIFNDKRFDSWTAFALLTSTKLLEDYPDEGVHLTTFSEANKFIGMAHFCISLFNKSIEFGSNDSKIFVEYGAFLYKIHSYCSREIKHDELVKHFVEPTLKDTLSENKLEFLNLAYGAYWNAIKCSKSAQTAKGASSSGQDEGSSSDKSNIDQQQQQAENEDDDDDFDEELWLYHYMLGKIKEKLASSDLMECLQQYQQSAECLLKSKAIYLKKLSYKTQGHLSVESNEVYYRIYAQTLKKIEQLGLANKTKELTELLTFLEGVMEAKFVQKFNDLQFEEIKQYLHEHIFSKSQLISQMPCKEVFTKCVVICIAGLNQILRRFPQHYRSWYRLAQFYAQFLDFEFYEQAKNVLLSVSPSWSGLPYMPNAGLLLERNKTNYFNGIWRISNSDLEREGSFWSHLFQVTRLLIDILVKTSDAYNLIDLSKCLYQKPDNDKKYLDDSQREHLANLSCTTAYKILKTMAHERFDNKTFASIEEFNAYQRNLVPILLDSYELNRVISKNCEELGKDIEQLLRHLYIQFHPEQLSRVDRITMEDITKYCLGLEKKDKPIRAKPKK